MRSSEYALKQYSGCLYDKGEIQMDRGEINALKALGRGSRVRTKERRRKQLPNLTAPGNKPHPSPDILVLEFQASDP